MAIAYSTLPYILSIFPYRLLTTLTTNTTSTNNYTYLSKMQLISLLITLFAFLSITTAHPTTSSPALQVGTFTLNVNPTTHFLSIASCAKLLPDGPPINGMDNLTYSIDNGFTCATY